METLLEKSLQLVRRIDNTFSRYLLPQIQWKNRLIGIKGSRGTGKTTLLLQRLKMLDLPAHQAAYLR